MVGPSAPSGEHSHRAAPPPDPSVPTPCQEAPAPELPVRFAAGRIDRQEAAYRQRIGTDRVGEEEKCAPPRGFAPSTFRCYLELARFEPRPALLCPRCQTFRLGVVPSGDGEASAREGRLYRQGSFC